MTGWIILSAVIALLVLLCLLPVGIHIRYDGEVFPKLLIGPFSMTLLPKKKAVGKEAEEEKVEKKTDDGEKKKKAFQKPNREQIVYCLQTLPGIGPTYAQRIIDYREEHGPFRTVGELMNISGIGEKRLEAIWDLVTTGG